MILKPNQRSQIMPLPVVLISTLSPDGVHNCAPWSRVTPVLRPLDEFEMAGLKLRPSARVKPAGVEGCLAWAECVVEEEISREKFVLIIGKVVHLEVDGRFFSESQGMDFEKAKPLCGMGGEKGMQFAYPVSTGTGAGYAAMLGAPK